MDVFFIVLLAALVIFFVIEIRRTLRRSKKSVGLINKYLNDKNNPALIEEIYDFVKNESRLNKIINKYGADKSDFTKLHKKLMVWGDFKKYNRYIPITSFFYASALEYLLSHKNDDAKSLTKKMMNYFHI